MTKGFVIPAKAGIQDRQIIFLTFLIGGNSGRELPRDVP